MSDTASLRIIDPPRRLSKPERTLLEALLAEQFPGFEALRSQAVVTRVRGECSCGCGSIVLTLEHDPSNRAEVLGRIPVEATSTNRTGEHVPIDVLLHVVDGYLDELEIVNYDQSRAPYPNPESLKIFVNDEDFATGRVSWVRDPESLVREKLT